MKTHEDGTAPVNGEIFVFGSNTAGCHGAGAAQHALRYFGAKWGYGFGLIGQSYAIPTKDDNIKTLPFHEVEIFIRNFNTFAEENPQIEFWLTRVGCQLAGFKDAQIAPLFKKLDNVNYPEQWVQYIK